MRQNGFVCKIDLTLIWGGVQGGVVAGAGRAYTDKTDKEGLRRVVLGKDFHDARIVGIDGVADGEDFGFERSADDFCAGERV